MVCNPERFDCTEIYLHIPIDLQRAAWKYSRANHTKLNQEQAYLNYLCLELTRSWLSETFNDRVVKLDNQRHQLSPLWELMNGTPIYLDDYRLCLIPDTACDRSELRVPCEWVEIPDLVADYYLSVQIDPDTRSAVIWGYTTHCHLQQLAMYDDLDRTYCLDAEDLIGDLNIFTLAMQSSRLEPTRAAVNPIDFVTPSEAERYLQTWRREEFAVPRLDVGEADFPRWLALVANERWRQNLYEQRLGLTADLVT
jgi:hypothetical protein